MARRERAGFFRPHLVAPYAASPSKCVAPYAASAQQIAEQMRRTMRRGSTEHRVAPRRRDGVPLADAKHADRGGDPNPDRHCEDEELLPGRRMKTRELAGMKLRIEGGGKREEEGGEMEE
eukprot:2841561-Rhodomonas_salina.1